MRRWAVWSLSALILLGALAFAAYRIYLHEAHDDAVELVPPNALVYGNLFLDPSTHQKQALRDLLAKFPAAGKPSDAHDALAAFLDGALAGTGIDFTHDVEPWVGRQVAFAVLPSPDEGHDPGVVSLIATTDEERSLEAVDKARRETNEAAPERGSYRDESYETNRGGTTTGVVNDFLVIASDVETFERVVDAAEGRSLGSTEGFESTVALLPPDRSALFYASLARVRAELDDAGVPVGRIGALGGVKPVAVGGYLRSDGVVLESATRTGSPDTQPGLGAIARVPENAWAAIGVRDLGGTLRSGLANVPAGTPGLVAEVTLAQVEKVTGLDLREDVLPWMGDAAAYVGGTKTVRGGVVIATRAPERSAAAVRRLGEALKSQGLPVGLATRDGRPMVAFADPSLPALIELVARPASVWLTYGAEALDEVDGPPLRGPVFREARGALGDYSMAGFLDVGRAVAFGEQQYLRTRAALPPGYVGGVKPNLDPVSYVVVGTRTSGGVTSVRMKIGVE